MPTRTATLLVLAVVLAAGAAPARAQNEGVDPRWLAYLGCWEPIESAKSQLCLVPATGASTVDLVTVVKGEVTARERIAAMGERVETIKGDCVAWHSAAWSANGQRIYLRSDDPCAGGTGRHGTGLIAMSGNSQWLYIQGMTVGGQTGLRVQRYREAPADILLPNEVAEALRIGVSAMSEVRAAAAAPLSINDVIEASKSLETAVLEAWLVERGEPFMLDAKRLIALADAGVPAPVIDLMVALSYPKVFAINAASRRGERRVAAADSSYRSAGRIAAIDPFCHTAYLLNPLDPYASYDCAGLGGYGYRYGYGYGHGWYPGGYPVTIVVIRPGGGSSRPHGRVVNGQGYAQGESSGNAATPRSIEPAQPRSSGSPASAPPPPAPSSGGGEQRTAKPRPH